jgi:hypothetical protein
LPYYIDGELRLTQSDAILLHVAERARLLGATDGARAHALMLLGVASDLRRGCVCARACVCACVRVCVCVCVRVCACVLLRAGARAVCGG